MGLDPDEERLADNIRQFGWHGEWVAGADGEPPFVYSVGFLETLGAPEFIVFGLRLELMHDMLWTVFRRIQAGAEPAADARWPGALPGTDACSRPVHSTQLPRGHFGRAALRHVRRGQALEGFRGAQLFWPSRIEGLYPWDAGCPDEVVALQPRLDLPNVEGRA
jgi:hypothetical protein